MGKIVIVRKKIMRIDANGKGARVVITKDVVTRKDKPAPAKPRLNIT